MRWLSDLSNVLDFCKKSPSVDLATLSNSPKSSTIIPQLLRRKTVHKKSKAILSRSHSSLQDNEIYAHTRTVKVVFCFSQY